MRHRGRISWGLRTALVAACILVLQGLAGAFATGAAAGSSTLDAFGNPLCVAGMDAGAMQGDRDHPALPGCCTGACGMFALPDAGGPAPQSLSNPLPLVAGAGTTRDVAAFRPAPGHDPGSPRAPPVAA